MPAQEQPIGLQADTLSTPASVRMVTAYVIVNGMLTPVQMQVVTISDGAGKILDFDQVTDPMLLVLAELQQMRSLLHVIAQVPQFDSLSSNTPRT